MNAELKDMTIERLKAWQKKNSNTLPESILSIVVVLPSEEEWRQVLENESLRIVINATRDSLLIHSERSLQLGPVANLLPPHLHEPIRFKPGELWNL